MSTNTASGRAPVFAYQSAPGGAPSPSTHTMIGPGYVTMPPPGGSPTTPQLPPYDPVIDGDYYNDQWHFDYIGDIRTIWEEYSGDGVNVGMYDDNLEWMHPDLVENYNPDLEVYINGVKLPSYTGMLAPHGTSVAGLIVAGDNGFGTVGVAHGAGLTAVPIIDTGGGPADINYNYAGFIQAVQQADNFDVVNNSWGKYPGFWQGGELGPGLPEQDAQLIDAWEGVTESGRDGLGTVIVKAAGNDDRNANGDAPAATRVAIVVGAYDDDGDASYYSSWGANLLVSAPSSGDNNRGLVTTDMMGFEGYNIIDQAFTQYLDTEYTNAFGGTSGATPIVTGVIALMLEANPDLGWRDVQDIIAYSAHEVGSGVGGGRTSSEDHDWRYNGADNWNGGGLHYSEDYGFGSINAYNAVRMAEAWSLFGGPQASANETSYSNTITNVVLPDVTTTDIVFNFAGSSFDVESVTVELDISHLAKSLDIYLATSGIGDLFAENFEAFMSDLDITLISPDGTETLLADFDRDLALEYGANGWKATFNANTFRGEDGIGTWTLRINDPWDGDAGTVNSATVTLHGRDGDQQDLGDDVYHYTNEVFTTLDRDAARQTLTDTDGGTDWVNLAAMTGDVIVRLVAGQTSTGTSASGVRDVFTIAAGAAIENAVTGDGNDRLIGNDLGNVLHGMRGNDAIEGGAGADRLSGGAGTDTLTGGADADTFLFDRALNAATNVDIITDFSHLDDSIWLDASIFAGLSLGSLSEELFFVIGSGTEGAEDRVLYDGSTGALYFDIDGAGGLAAVQFANLQNTPANLSFDDFVIVDTSNTVITTAGDIETSDATVEYTDVDEVLGDGTPIEGSEGHDDIRAKHHDDVIHGNGGTDFIYSGAGNDYIDGGAAYDVISAGDGDDVVVGGGSHPRWGDIIYGDGGNDTLTGSDDQPNGTSIFWGDRGDLIDGGDGNDQIFGLNGDDKLFGGAGNDTIYGDRGNDSIGGGDGDDLMYAGTGKNVVEGGAGTDTLVFTGNIADYRFYFVGTNFSGDIAEGGLRVERINAPAGENELNNVWWRDTEYLQFADETLAIAPSTGHAIVLEAYGNSVGADRPAVELVADGTQMGASVQGASTVSIIDMGAETGAADRMQAIELAYVYGNIDIRSDAAGYVTLRSLGMSDWGPSGGLMLEPYDAKVEVYAAAGQRNIDFDIGTTDLGPNGLIADRTATSASLSTDFSYVSHLNGAGADGYNLAFDSATSVRLKDVGDSEIQWYVPNATRIEIYYEQFEDPAHLTREGNIGIVEIETALDDKFLATAGGSAEYIFDADIWTPDYYEPSDPSLAHTSEGSERIRFGNLGKVNASNDGTTGEDAEMNAGLGLRGRVELGQGNDEARILGSGAFKGGTVDAGTGAGINWETGEADVLRMTMGVAAAIGNISGNISNFEVLQLDTPTQAPTQQDWHGWWWHPPKPSTKENTVDVRNFDSLKRIDITGSDAQNGDSRVINIGAESTVTFRNVGDSRLVQNNQNEIFSTYDKYGSNFGKVRLDMAGSGRSDVLTLAFVGLLAQGLQTGTVNVADAETVRITTDARDQDTYVWNSEWFFPEPMSAEPTDPFAQVLDLDQTKTVILSGDTGWDFTLVGSDISKVTSLDASGVWASGAVGAVKAKASASNVVFIGGAGDDALTGAQGDDVLRGGDGNDVLRGGSGDDLIDGGPGDDVMDGGPGNDTLSYASATSGVTVSLAASGAQDTGGGGLDTASNFENLVGSSHDDNLTGNNGDNVVDGGPGADAMAAGKGDDTYIVDNVGDTVSELSRQGSDTVKSSVSFTLGANVEDLTLTGNQAIDGTGNELANKIHGNAAGNVLKGLGGDDRIYGRSGADTIEGGAGRDWLFGGKGDDAFVFNTALSSRSNTDTIADFDVGDDVIHLDNAIFTALFGSEGSVLSAEQFYRGSEAHDANDRIIYNPRTGELIYDSNGKSHGGEVEIATLSRGLNVNHDEFIIV